jgi:hypothetical protein
LTPNTAVAYFLGMDIGTSLEELLEQKITRREAVAVAERLGSKVWYTVEEAARAYGVSRSTIFVWLKRGLLVAHHPPPVRLNASRHGGPGRRLTLLSARELERFASTWERSRPDIECADVTAQKKIS